MRILDFFLNSAKSSQDVKKKKEIFHGFSILIIAKATNNFLRINFAEEDSADFIRALRYQMNYSKPSVRYATYNKLAERAGKFLRQHADKNSKFTIITCEKKDSLKILNAKNINVSFILYGIDRYWVEVYKNYFDIY